ncbi:hypothetical protein CC2G_011375 [Coprinopsis cinerea AmutBmut pab1-1]|nr:hypothetical protein CC2G_011375 [Coprinopsis cinerea AmutBmut pab1-1]
MPPNSLHSSKTLRTLKLLKPFSLLAHPRPNTSSRKLPQAKGHISAKSQSNHLLFPPNHPAMSKVNRVRLPSHVFKEVV